MSKELKALQKLRDLVENLTRIDYVPTDLRNEVKELLIKSYEDSEGFFFQIEVALNELEDAKHNYNALKEFYNNATAYGAKIQEELNELKKRDEPMEIIITRFVNGKTNFWDEPICPKCKSIVYIEDKFCCECGQALDWGDKK